MLLAWRFEPNIYFTFTLYYRSFTLVSSLQCSSIYSVFIIIYYIFVLIKNIFVTFFHKMFLLLICLSHKM